jgi:hypothetical protein
MAATGLLKDKNSRDMPTVPKGGSQTVFFDASTTSNRTTALTGNVCFVLSTADVWIKRGGSSVTGVATAGADAFFIPANSGYWDIDLPADENYLAPLAESGTGTLHVIYTSEVRN